MRKSTLNSQRFQACFSDRPKVVVICQLRQTGLVEPVTSPAPKGNRYTKGLRLNGPAAFPGGLALPPLEGRNRFLFGVFPGNEQVVDPVSPARVLVHNSQEARRKAASKNLA